MGSFISTVRDVKIILRDLKITLKFTAKIVLKVHGIVDEMENTMQELKETVNGLSSRLPKTAKEKENSLDEATKNYVNEVVHTIESKAESMKACLSNTVAVFTSDDLVKNTSSAWQNVVGHKNLTEVITKWASVPDGIGELVKQDCKRLVEFVDGTDANNIPIITTQEVIKNIEMDRSGKLDVDMDLVLKHPSVDMRQLISSDPNPGKLLSKIPSMNECYTPEIATIENIFTHRILDGERLLKRVGPLYTFKVKYNPEWLSTIVKARQMSSPTTMKHQSNQQNATGKTPGSNHTDMATIGEYQTEFISLLLVTLLQGFLKTHDISGKDGGSTYLTNS